MIKEMKIMSNIVITKNMSTEERLVVLKEAHQRILKKQSIRARLAEGARRVRKWSDEVETTKEKKLNDSISKMDENHNHYQDGSTYLAKHYGSRLADQKSYESEEGWN